MDGSRHAVFTGDPAFRTDADRRAPEPGGRVFTRATVFIRGVETGYERVGSGGTVVVLVTDPVARSELVRSLAASNRVIVPDPVRPDGTRSAIPPDACDWLRCLLVGLGIEVAGLITDDAWTPAGLCLALAEPVRVDRLVLIIGAKDASMTRSGIEDRLAGTGQRLLMIAAVERGGQHDHWPPIETFFSEIPIPANPSQAGR